MTSRFKIPLEQDQVFALLGTAVYAEVKKRGMPYERNAVIDGHLGKISEWITDLEKKPWLAICGNCGNGKTTVMKAFATIIEKLWLAEYVEGQYIRMRVRTITAKELAAECIRGYDDFKSVISAPMLAIDDIGTEPVSLKDYGTLLTPVADMVDYRYEHGLFTMITTNIAPPDISERYGERTADRLREMAEIIPFKNESYRKQICSIAKEKEVQQC